MGGSSETGLSLQDFVPPDSHGGGGVEGQTGRGRVTVGVRVIVCTVRTCE